MKRIFAIMGVLALGAALGGVALQVSPGARSVFAWIAPPRHEKQTSTQAEPAVQKDASSPSASKGEPGKPPDGLITMASEQIEAQGIEIAIVEKGILARRLTVPGTVTLDMDLVARVPGRVVGTVTQLRKRLGDSVAQGEVVAVLDSREVADAKSEYLTASVGFDLRKTMYERAQILWAKKISAEQQYLQSRATFLEAELRLDLARQKLSALKLDPAEVEKAAKQESALKSGVSSLREYEIRSLIGGRIIERKVDVGTLIGNQGDPPDLYTVADLSLVWIELAAPTADLDVIQEGQTVEITSGRDSGKRGVGRIIFISPLVDPDTRSARLIAQIDNKAQIWRPGSVVTARIVTKEEPVDVRVPRIALQTIGGEHVVFVRTPNGFLRRAVTIGRSDEQDVEIISGLSTGEQIAVKNTFLLKAELGKGD
ncbi:efflux RND transporter periplasmic adaptor subunit [Methylocapsa polymorpha]|uniref:Efflux RND transporter periplasmic adaptor subunit n=1 Tax=Methylocapsa polymorpha TaxID=3080828 RepID=A0ABZ0HXB7_9HYPH|nr:efflux RND transporter periplasmic adaptor subunit [Methylocapsa sp. RX1]